MWSFQITGRIGHVWEFGIQRQAESSTCQHLVRPHQKHLHPLPHQPALLCTYMWSRLLQSCWKGENLPVQEVWVEYTRCSNNLYCYFWYLLHTFHMHEHIGFNNSRDWMISFPALLLYFRWCSYSCRVPSLRSWQLLEDAIKVWRCWFWSLCTNVKMLHHFDDSL